MSVRRFLILYFGAVALLAVTGTAAIRAVKERHATVVAALEPPPPVIASPPQLAAPRVSGPADIASAATAPPRRAAKRAQPRQQAREWASRGVGAATA